MASDDSDTKSDNHEANGSSDSNGTSIIDDDDPIVQEIPIFLAKGLSNNLYLLQYPLRPANMPYEGRSVLETRIRGDQLEMTVGMETRGVTGQHYSQSKGMQYSGHTGGLMDRIVLSSHSSKSVDMSRYVAGVFKDNQIHLTPLKNIIQLRPCLRHIERLNESGRVPGTGGVGGASDGETTATESEEEEAKPVTVRFAKAGAKDRQKAESEEPWKALNYHSLESNEATIERELLFAGDDNHTEEFSVTPSEYLDMVCPVGTMQKNASPLGPSDVLSLTTLKTLPHEKQIIELMKKAVVLSFDNVSMLLGRVKGERGSVLEYLQKCSLLVQGCWVVHSALLLTKESASLRNARDYILWCFTQQRTITRKDLAATLKITTQQLRDILKPIACQRPEGGWQFKMETDQDFISKYPQVVSSQETLWQRRHTELIQVYGLGTSPTAPLSTSASEGKTASGSRTKTSQLSEAKIDSTPARTRPLQPNQLDVDRTGSGASLKDFCHTAIGRTVVSLSELRDRLLRHQSSLAKDNPLRGQGVSNELLVNTLKDIGCVELGQGHSKRLFVIPSIGDHTDVYRSVIIDLLKTSKSLKRKQVVDAINSQNVTCDNKTLTSVLRDLCNSKGAQWHLKGTI